MGEHVLHLVQAFEVCGAVRVQFSRHVEQKSLHVTALGGQQACYGEAVAAVATGTGEHHEPAFVSEALKQRRRDGL